MPYTFVIKFNDSQMKMRSTTRPVLHQYTKSAVVLAYTKDHCLPMME